jgi:hypothetical protein
MNGMWIIRHVLLCFGGWLLITTTYFLTKEFLKREFPEYAEPWRPLDPKPNPLPSRARKLAIMIYPSGAAIGTAFFLSCILSNYSHWIDTLVTLSCLMLPSVWWSVDTYFNERENRRRQERMKEWERKLNREYSDSPRANEAGKEETLEKVEQ